MAYCPNCGAQIPAEVKFCPACGQELLSSEELVLDDHERSLAQTPTKAAIKADKASVQADVVKEAGTGRSADTGGAESETLSEILPQTEAGSTKLEPEPEAQPEPQLAKSTTRSEQPNPSDTTFSETTTPTAELLTAASKGKSYAASYFKWLNSNLKGPRLNQHQGRFSYSLISLFVILAANGVAISRLLSSTVQRLMTQVQLLGLSYRYDGPQLLFFFEVLLYLVLSFVVLLLVYYFVAAKVNSRRVSVRETLTEIVGPAAFSVYLSLVSMLVTLVLPYMPELGLALVTVSLFLLVASFLGNLWRTPATSLGVNRFYTTVIALLIVVLVSLMLGRLFLGQMVEDLPIQRQFPEGFEDFFNQDDFYF